MSEQFDQFKETFEEFYPEYKSWVEENSADFPPEKMGNGAFTTQEASDLLLEFAETIKIVLENKEQCFKHVNSSELSTIDKNFSDILGAAKSEIYSDFVNGIELMIPRMRPFQFLSMEKMDEKRYREVNDMDKTLSDIKGIKKSVTSNANKVLSDSEKVRKLIELTNQKNEELKSLIDDNNQQTNNVAELHVKTSEYLNQIKEIFNSASKYKATIENSVSLIQERAEKLSSQHKLAKEHEEKLKDFFDEHELNVKKAEDLIQKSYDALNLSTANKLSGAFQARQDKLENPWVKCAWLCLGGIAVAVAVGLGIAIIFFDKDDPTIISVVVRALVTMILIGVAIFCSRQYAKNRSFEEDYAYKVALAASFPGLDEAFEQAGLRKEYAGKLLDEILQDPQRLRPNKGSSEDNYPSAAESQKNSEKK